MVRMNFPEVPDAKSFMPVPAGKYLCKLVDVNETQTQRGDEMWKLKFEIMDGEYDGRFIFDNMVFSKAAESRVKLICSRLGLETEKELEFYPEDLKGRSCFVIVEIEEYEDNKGRKRMRNRVPFDGYEKIEDGTPKQINEPKPEEDLPW